ncbi:hypothetical protein L596_030190 [Steinernema carpocapsae]|uniref:Uncharacterized protein n=1 Tax=Steinernema carpocapsae TaxID=34508 RepID=A0A4U5LRZ7_STECR|nr:hypothetical protein L596_030190 [Steinernema carpocapsae]
MHSPNTLRQTVPAKEVIWNHNLIFFKLEQLVISQIQQPILELNLIWADSHVLQQRMSLKQRPQITTLQTKVNHSPFDANRLTGKTWRKSPPRSMILPPKGRHFS